MDKPYYVFSIWDEPNGTRHKAASDYATIDTAQKAYHAMLANHIDSADTIYVVACLINRNGNMIESKSWERSEAAE